MPDVSQAMNRPNPNGAIIEATLDELYANEINLALSWDHKRGFLAVLGNPPMAKKNLSDHWRGRWLKEQALRHFPSAEFRTGSVDTDGREAILDHLCASHIAGSISWTSDGGFHATLGEPKVAEKWAAASAGEAIEWLRDQAILHYPDSEFAHQYAGFGFSPVARG
jgi:disulfide oxidoreductase YuzD